MDSSTSTCTSIWMEIATTLRAYPVQRGALYRLLESRAVEYREVKSTSGKRGRKLVNVVSLRAYLERKGQIAADPPIKTWLAECWRSPRFREVIQDLCVDLAGVWRMHFDLPKAGREPVVSAATAEDFLARRPNYQFFERLHVECEAVFERAVHGRLRSILDDVAATTNQVVAGFRTIPDCDMPRLYCACMTRVLFHQPIDEQWFVALGNKLRFYPDTSEMPLAWIGDVAVAPEQDDARLSLAELLVHPSVTQAERLLIKCTLEGHSAWEIAENPQLFGLPSNYPTSITGVRHNINKLIKKLRKIYLNEF